jgi:hypothetical protein
VPVLHYADIATQVALAPLAGAALLATNLAVLRPHRDGAGIRNRSAVSALHLSQLSGRKMQVITMGCDGSTPVEVSHPGNQIVVRTQPIDLLSEGREAPLGKPHHGGWNRVQELHAASRRRCR